MILAVDVQYSENNAVVAGVLFKSWQNEDSEKEYVSLMDEVADYEPGKFFKRELPCILKLIENYHLKPECIVVDGFVFLDGFSKAGLGKHLFDALNGEVSVIGIAKKNDIRISIHNLKLIVGTVEDLCTLQLWALKHSRQKEMLLPCMVTTGFQP